MRTAALAPRAVVLREEVVAGDGLLPEVIKRATGAEVQRVVGLVGLAVEEIDGRRGRVAIGIIVARVEQRGVLRADGQRLTGLDSMEVDEIADDVALDGLPESGAAALGPLEKVRSTEADEALAGAGEVAENLGFALCGRLVERGVDVVRQTVARQVQEADSRRGGC